MATSSSRRPCSKCDKGAGILTCDGCQQSFCTKHITVHRHELSIEMDKIVQEYDILRQNVFRDDKNFDALTNCINQWETESIKKINEIAQQFRNDLEKHMNNDKSQLNILLKNLADQLQSSRDSGDYTEIDFQLWTQQLTQLRQTSDQIMNINLVDDDEKIFVPIRMLKLKAKCSNISIENQSNFNENQIYFNQFVGNVQFSDNNRVATHSDESNRSSMVCLNKFYSNGIHQIRFRLERKRNRYIFFGIINSQEKTSRQVFNSSSLHGWMQSDIRIIKSQKTPSSYSHGNFNENDEIIFTLNCNNRCIAYENPRLNLIDRIDISNDVCPFPWRIVFAFFTLNDAVRIID